MKKFTKEHEWTLAKENIVTIGISAHAAKELGDITFVELPTVGNEIAAGDVLTVVESVKAASDVFSPLSGKVVDVNQTLENNPQLINGSPEEEGWICKIEATDLSELDDLMTADAYKAYLNTL